jgi:DNA ligase-1
MRRFAALYAELDASTATAAKLAALQRYLASADGADAAWALYFLAGGKPQQTLPTALLRAEAAAAAGISDWLFEACYQAVGDLAETIALVLPPPRQHSDLGLAAWLGQRLLPLRGAAPALQAQALRDWWDELPTAQRFLLGKLIGGGFRVGVSRLLVQRAIALHAGLDPKLVAQRLVGWTDARQLPTADRLQALLAAADTSPAAATGQPFPFFLAHAVQAAPADFERLLGPVGHWLAEWKYDGIRAQIVCQAGQVWIWSRGEELITERFPEVVAVAQGLPDGSVLDGELLVWIGGAPAPFKQLQTRLNRKTLSRKLLVDAPVRFIAYDLLALAGADLRSQPQHARRRQLEALLAATPLPLSPLLVAEDWAGLAALRDESRQRGVEGLMLKHQDAAYGSGRTKSTGTWWKWKVDAMTVDAVLVYAQAGHGRRAGLYTDYTFAVWSRPPESKAEADAVIEAIARREPPLPGALQLLTFAKAYAGLTDAEFKAVDKVIRANTLEKFGPVRSLRPTLVFELAFEGIAHSPRHKSGVALRFPRMLRLRHDKALHEADSLALLSDFISQAAAGH